MPHPLIETRHIRKRFGRQNKRESRNDGISAVNDVSLTIEAGSSVALVGESGSGKSTLGRMMSGLERPTEGQTLFRGTDISSLSLKEMQPYRKQIQMIFQNSAGVFDPAYTIGQSIAEVLRNNGKAASKGCAEQVADILSRVGLEKSHGNRYGRELSGGQRQRANIARALVLRPEFVVCDEPVSSLDYSLRKQILNLLNELREAFGLTYLFITHDLHCVPYVCDHMAIMYAGQIVETLDLRHISMPQVAHSYSRLLLASLPVTNPRLRRKRTAEAGDGLPLVTDTQQCCRFYARCQHTREQCRTQTPLLHKIASGHYIACHRF